MKKPFHFKSRKEWEEFVWKNFVIRIRETKTNEQLEKLLGNVISAREKRFIINRIATISFLKEGKNYREIGELLWVSPVTISAIKRSLFNHQEYTNNRATKKKKQKTKKQDKNLVELLENWLWTFPPPPTYVGKGRWRFLKHQG